MWFCHLIDFKTFGILQALIPDFWTLETVLDQVSLSKVWQCPKLLDFRVQYMCSVT